MCTVHYPPDRLLCCVPWQNYEVQREAMITDRTEIQKMLISALKWPKKDHSEIQFIIVQNFIKLCRKRKFSYSLINMKS